MENEQPIRNHGILRSIDERNRGNPKSIHQADSAKIQKRPLWL